MNADQFDDLKQFISASISQSETRLRDDMQTGFQAVRQEMADGFLAVGEAIDDIHKQMEEHRTSTDTRLKKLEHRLA
jgi:hypothetical protein